ncbi:hypothetical protein, partial [Silvibacterium sp.]|uniref:hypothetical protein n=1 Tax=Silvibacterium sp. TaxID=1964179 RepID=UPI0039E5124A
DAGLAKATAGGGIGEGDAGLAKAMAGGGTGDGVAGLMAIAEAKGRAKEARARTEVILDMRDIS